MNIEVARLILTLVVSLDSVWFRNIGLERGICSGIMLVLRIGFGIRMMIILALQT